MQFSCNVEISFLGDKAVMNTHELLKVMLNAGKDIVLHIA